MFDLRQKLRLPFVHAAVVVAALMAADFSLLWVAGSRLPNPVWACGVGILVLPTGLLTAPLMIFTRSVRFLDAWFSLTVALNWALISVIMGGVFERFWHRTVEAGDLPQPAKKSA